MSAQKISIKELQQMLEEGKDVFVLDIRPKEQREEWMIAGSHYKDAYAALSQGDNTILDDIEISPDVPVVTVCAAGRSSQIAADLLKEKGYDAYSLEGGMKAWNYAWNTAEIKDDNVTLVQVRRTAKGCLSYIVGSQGEAAVVDASLDPQVYLDIAAQHNWTIKYVMDTHVHADYISRTIDLAKSSGAQHLFTENAEVDYPFIPLRDGDEIPIGTTLLAAVHTPGHTPESVSYLVDNRYLLTGDTLFIEGVGRPDLKADEELGQQKAAQLFDSLGKILVLSHADLLILPAHTSQSIAFDKKVIAGQLSELSTKIELLHLEKSAFIKQTMLRIPPTPPNYLQIASINKTGNYDGINPADLEAGANRCAVS
jgi:glyoxylase-like metal-dependent hydrolase (beta-lactamase superfamily II)/rhodanese-related sulfurtransferase